MNGLVYRYYRYKRLLMKPLTWHDVEKRNFLYLYAGDIPIEYAGVHPYGKKLVGLSITKSDGLQIMHDVTKPYPLPDACVDYYQAEDVFEHIEYKLLRSVINEIWRVLKPGGVLRISVPDYRAKINRASCIFENDEIVYDPGGGGEYIDGKVVGGGHVWFPISSTVEALLQTTLFSGNYKLLHYVDEQGNDVLNPIDYSIGYISRTPDHSEHDYDGVISIVVDCVKK